MWTAADETHRTKRIWIIHGRSKLFFLAGNSMRMQIKLQIWRSHKSISGLFVDTFSSFHQRWSLNGRRSCMRQVAPSSARQSACSCWGSEEGGLTVRGSGLLCGRCWVDSSAAGESARSPFQPRKDCIYFLLWTSASCCVTTMCCVVKNNLLLLILKIALGG